MNTATLGRVVVVLGLVGRKIIVKPRESFLSARMALWVVLVSVLARLTSLPRAHQITSLKFRSPSAVDRDETAAQLARTLDSLLGLDLFVFRRSCWKRAMVLHRFLALNGIESRINFGLQKRADGTVQGHAWLERQGRPLLEEEDAGTYVVTFSLPRTLAAPQRRGLRP
jgi:transglutaminase superfamily protein